MNIEKKLEAELTVANAIKEMDTETLIIMENKYRNVKYSKSMQKKAYISIIKQYKVPFQ